MLKFGEDSNIRDAGVLTAYNHLRKNLLLQSRKTTGIPHTDAFLGKVGRPFMFTSLIDLSLDSLY